VQLYSAVFILTTFVVSARQHYRYKLHARNTGTIPPNTHKNIIFPAKPTIYQKQRHFQYPSPENEHTTRDLENSTKSEIVVSSADGTQPLVKFITISMIFHLQQLLLLLFEWSMNRSLQCARKAPIDKEKFLILDEELNHIVYDENPFH
jgi:hypothetical protein